MPTAKDKQRVMVTLTAQQVEKLDAIAAETGVSRSGTVSLALSQWLRGWNPPEAAESAAWPEYSFVIDGTDSELEERPELYVHLPNRTAAVKWAKWYDMGHKAHGLHVDWIFERDEQGNASGSTPIGDYNMQRCAESDVTWDD